MANPTVAELAARVDAGGDKKSGVAMNMAAIAGLRGILALSVARGVVRGHLFIYCPGHWRDDGVGYGDMFQFYRTLFFMLLAAMSLSIQYDAVELPTRDLVLANGMVLLPTYLVGLACATPITTLPCASRSLAWLQYAFCATMQQGWYVGGVRDGPGTNRLAIMPMTHCWYLTSQLCFLVLFNFFQDLAKLGQEKRAKFPTSKAPISAVKRHPVRSPRDLFDRASCLTYWFFALRMVVLIAGGWWPLHASPPMQMMTFYAGVLLGQAALHVPLTPAAERTWARLTDGLVLGFLVMIFSWGGLWFFLLRLGGEPLFVVLLFGITRSDCYAARVCARFAELGQYSYAIYIIHPPVIKWAKFTAAARSGNVVVVRRAPEFVRNASPKRENTREISKKKRRETPLGVARHPSLGPAL
ncbi:hypothetical protein JL722_14397 [Aureococcus anophagefferens]|nr:hypothetical protein JL722_14397 [Aureococcus anophagefferens]